MIKQKHIARIENYRDTDDFNIKMQLIVLAEYLRENIPDDEFNKNIQLHRDFFHNKKARKVIKKAFKKKRKGKYGRYMDSPEWVIKKNQVFDLKGRLCEACGSDHNIHVHHAHYKSVGNENPVIDLYVLCHQCHSEYHGYFSAAETSITRTTDFIRNKILESSL